MPAGAARGLGRCQSIRRQHNGSHHRPARPLPRSCSPGAAASWFATAAGAFSRLLVEAQHNEEKWNDLFTLVRPELLASVRPLLASWFGESISAVLGDVWEKGRKGIKDLNSSGSDDKVKRRLLAWLKQVFRNAFHNHVIRFVRKQAGKRVPLAVEDATAQQAGFIPAAPDPAPLDALIVSEDLAWLDAALGVLPPEDQELINLVYRDGVSLREIGRRRGCHEASVRRRLAKVLARLRAARGT